MLVELCGTLVFIEHGKAKLLDLLKVVVHLKLNSKHRVQIVHSCFSAAKLKDKKKSGEKDKTNKQKHMKTGDGNYNNICQILSPIPEVLQLLI